MKLEWDGQDPPLQWAREIICGCGGKIEEWAIDSPCGGAVMELDHRRSMITPTGAMNHLRGQVGHRDAVCQQ